MYSRDTLTIVTIPDYKLYKEKAFLIDMYRNMCGSHTIFVIEKMTKNVSSYLKQALNTNIRFAEGLTFDYEHLIGVYNCKEGESVSDAYNFLCTEFIYGYYCCVDPLVFTYESTISGINEIPFKKNIGARFVATRTTSKFYEDNTGRRNLELNLYKKDIENEFYRDFSVFPSKKYSITDYGVLLCRRDFLVKSGLFGKGYNRDFVYTACLHAASTDYNVEYSNSFFTYKAEG